MELESDKTPAAAVVAKPKPPVAQGATADADAARRPAALRDEDDGEAESGPPSSVSHSSKGRKRGKKARRAGAAADAKASSSSSHDRRQHSWSGQSFSDYGGGAGHNPGTRSTRSTPRGNNGSGSGFSNHGNGGGVGTVPASVESSATPRSGKGGATKGKWESTGARKQRRLSSTSDGALEAGNDEDGGGAKRGPQPEGGALWRQQSSSFVRDFIRGAGIHRMDPRRLSGPLTVVVSRMGLERAWAGAWVLLRRFLEYLLEVTREHERGRAGGGRARRGGGGGRVGNGHYHNHVGAAGWQQRQRWMPGRRVAAVASLTLLASYRRYQVTHPEVTTEHVLGAASSLVLALAAFLVHAAADLTIDACGAVIPSLCGTREARLAAAYSRLQDGGGGGGVSSSGGGGGGGAGEGRTVGQEGGPRVLGEGAGGAPGEGHDLDQYFVL